MNTLNLGICMLLATFFLNRAATAQTISTKAPPSSDISNADKTSQVGVGLQVGSLTGLTVDYWYSSDRSINAGFTVGDFNTAASLVHQWNFTGAFGGQANVLVPYIGAGLLAVFGNHTDYLADRTQDFAWAAQLPLGLEFLPEHQRFGIFAELVPGIELAPESFGFINGDVGARFYF